MSSNIRPIFRDSTGIRRGLSTRLNRLIYGLPDRGMRSRVKTRVNLWRNRSRQNRRLEIGPGKDRNPEYETLDVIDAPNVDYVKDVRSRLPFADFTFEKIYASHVLEHIPWYQTEQVLSEWVRIIKPGGSLTIFVPNALKISDAVLRYEATGENLMTNETWFKANPGKTLNHKGKFTINPETDFFRWASYRIFTYGDGKNALGHPNWHRAMFTPKLLTELFLKAGLSDIQPALESDVLGSDHGWINLGMTGTRPPAQDPPIHQRLAS